MSLYPQDAPPNARPCEECDGHGTITQYHADGDIRAVDDCRKCHGGGHVVCINFGSAKVPCKGFAVRFFADGDDDLCSWCWSHCDRCHESMLAFPDETLCPVCDSTLLIDRPMSQLVAAAKGPR